ncbi:DUF2254 domain-containing protein [Alicyclobacillaceae bacterium I2511]|nr:DUF2254 domain-containing protein [Alicyclobacillaceae bacterium I2511]
MLSMGGQSESWGQTVKMHVKLVVSSWIFHMLAASVVILLVFLHPPEVFSGDTDTARNYLNTIVSTLSTILALSISVILVAIQMTAGNYTHRVLDFFVRLPYNASLFVLYLFTIVHSFFLMAKIRDPLREPLPVSLRPEMSADLVLVVLCFLSLLLYLYAVVQLLKPEQIIELIEREYHRAFAKGRFRVALESVEQICDIAKRAASFADSLTATRCMEVMLQIAKQLPLPNDSKDALLQVHRNLVDQWVEIVGVAVKENEAGLIGIVLDDLQVQGLHYVERGAFDAVELVVRAYRHLAFSHLLYEGQVFYMERVVEHLYDVAASCSQQGERGRVFALRTWSVVRTVGEITFASQTSAIPVLLNGFLMHPRFEDTLAEFPTQDERAKGLAVYFGLWKSFAVGASVRDVARWATWWRDDITDPQLGQAMALLLARHLGREEVTQTLEWVWQTPLTRYHRECVDANFTPWLGDLFDGWPLPDLGIKDAKIKSAKF